MDLNFATALIIAIVAVIFSGFFSGSEIAFVQSSRVRMEIDAARGGMVNNILRGFTRHEDMFISTLLVGNNIVLVIYGIAFSALINPWLERTLGNEALVLISNTILSTLIILFTGEFLPKTTFRVNPNVTMRILALPLYVIYIILYPISLFISLISHGLMKLFGISREQETTHTLTFEQIDDYIQKSIDDHSDKQEVENEVKIFRNAIDFKDTQMDECMIPRNEIVAVALQDTSRHDLIQKFVQTGLSKIVVYGDDIDDIRGYIHVSELFKPDTDWREMLKPVIFTPGSMLANNMMRRMLSEKKSLVIVIDEFGGTAGLATLEDLMEEITGDLEDEHDKKRIEARRLSDGSIECSGRIEVESLNESFNFDIPESDEYHTLAGYLLENLEALPAEGDQFEIRDLRFNIVRMSDTRIELVNINRTNTENNLN